MGTDTMRNPRHAPGRLAWEPEKLEEVALDVRRNILTLLANAGTGHTGGSLSVTDFLTAIQFHEANIDPADPDWADRDYWHVSNAHVSPVIYSVMAERGYFPHRDLLKFRQIDGHLQGHPSAHDTPGIEASAGSIGQGLAVAAGVAMAAKMDDHPRRAYVVMGDGEQQEGSIWEAAMSASHYKLDNLCAVLDANRMQIDGPTDEVIKVEPLVEKYSAFGWHVIDIDGHDMGEILEGFAEARSVKGRPTILVARTVMGKGWDAIEDDFRWHGRPPTVEEADEALKALGTDYQAWRARLENNGVMP